MNPYRYLMFVFVLSAIAIGGYAGVVNIVDPYGFYRPHDVRGQFVIKPAMTKNQNMAKSHIIRALKPDTVIIGSSRADYGLSPNHPAFKNAVVYNAGVKGIRMSETKDMIIHAVENGAKHIIWAVDFFTFNLNIKPRPDFNRARLSYKGNINPQTDMDTLISISSLKPTLQTILHRNNNQVSTVQSNGQTTGADLDKKNTQKGMEQMFIDDVRLYLGRLYFPAPDRTFKIAKGSQNALSDMHDTMAYLRANDIQLTLFVPPVHVELLSLMYQSGLYPTYALWKTALYLNATEHKFTLYDFTALNDITTETIPSTMDDTMQYWWEASHYKPVIGDMMLSTLLSDTQNDLTVTTQNRQSIDGFKNAFRAYQCEHPKMVKRIRQAIIDGGLENRLIPPLICP